MNSKNRFFWFIGVVLLLGFLSYYLAISNTLTLRKQYRAAKADSNLTSNISTQLLLLAQKQAYYDSILTKLNLTDTSLENDLLRILNVESERLEIKIKEFKAPHQSTLDNSKLLTYNFTIEGTFLNLLKLVHNLEKNGTYGEVNHIAFKKERDFKRRKTILTATVFIQSIQ
ncbi:hypothetical protein [uncultured Croceitalea sp.]|uniref:hypothetical protein n=1 Tax=uncultured Croceitalea sp. TaxID=1798908 RepID=UPI003305BF77